MWNNSCFRSTRIVGDVSSSTWIKNEKKGHVKFINTQVNTWGANPLAFFNMCACARQTLGHSDLPWSLTKWDKLGSITQWIMVLYKKTLRL